jgi:hypothetical protein
MAATEAKPKLNEYISQIHIYPTSILILSSYKVIRNNFKKFKTKIIPNYV